jgi:hypothetical protein
MSTCCNIFLPSDVIISNVVEVIGILLGQEKIRQDLGQGDWACHVKSTNGFSFDNRNNSNIFIEATCIPGMVTIKIKRNKFDEFEYDANYFFETENGMRLLTGKDNYFWKSIGTGLIKFFGGYIDYTDSDNIEKDLEFEKPRNNNSPNDGDEWDKFQQELLDLKPLSEMKEKW